MSRMFIATRELFKAALFLFVLMVAPAWAQQPSEADLGKKIDAAYGVLQSGQTDEGFKQLRAALIEAARTDHYAFTVSRYTEAGVKLHENGFNEQAQQVFAEGEETRAMQADVKERADFYLAAARFSFPAMKDWATAYPRYIQATNLANQYYGGNSIELMNANDYLAVSLQSGGQLGTAANLLQRNHDLAVKALGLDAPMTWRLSNNLADLLRDIGAPLRALEYDRFVLEKRIGQYGKNHFNVLVSANNTGLDYLNLGNYPEAIRYFEMNKEIAVALQDERPGLVEQADAWILYTRLLSGAYELDEPSIAKMDTLITNADYPSILSLKAANLLADHFAKLGDANRSMKHLEQAYGIAGGEMSTTHPLTFAGRIAIANAKAQTDKSAAAADFASLDKDMLAWNALQVAFSGNRDFAEATRALADDMLFDYAALAEEAPSTVPAFADAVRRWPSLQDEQKDTLLKISRLIDPKDEETVALIQGVLRLSQVNKEIFSTGSDDELGYALLEQAKALSEQADKRLSERYALEQSAIDKPLPEPKELLGPNEAVVQYFITRKWRADRESTDPFEDTRLYAIVSRKDREPTLHNLGDPRKITAQDASVELAGLRATQGRGAVPMVAVDEAFSNLHAKLIAPLQADLKGAETLFIVPDGQLFALPFSLLKDGQGKLLEERFTVRLLTRPESLYGVTREQTLPKDGRAVLAGGITYANGQQRGAEPLPATLREVSAISSILQKDGFTTETLSGDAAGEATLRKDMEGATIAHLATHGAYQSADTGGAAGVDALWQSEVILSKSGDTRAMKRGDDDGRVYAFEMMTWNLSKLDLLVLSACETGRGEETFVGGLRGLPTAINIAGAKRSLLTLWPVADEGTANFMVQFYEHLSQGETYPAALRLTRRDAIDGRIEGAKDPLVWAAFVMFEN